MTGTACRTLKRLPGEDLECCSGSHSSAGADLQSSQSDDGGNPAVTRNWAVLLPCWCPCHDQHIFLTNLECCQTFEFTIADYLDSDWLFPRVHAAVMKTAIRRGGVYYTDAAGKILLNTTWFDEDLPFRPAGPPANKLRASTENPLKWVKPLPHSHLPHQSTLSGLFLLARNFIRGRYSEEVKQC